MTGASGCQRDRTCVCERDGDMLVGPSRFPLPVPDAMKEVSAHMFARRRLEVY